jgi:hypothetical protein
MFAQILESALQANFRALKQLGAANREILAFFGFFVADPALQRTFLTSH